MNMGIGHPVGGVAAAQGLFIIGGDSVPLPTKEVDTSQNDSEGIL